MTDTKKWTGKYKPIVTLYLVPVTSLLHLYINNDNNKWSMIRLYDSFNQLNYGESNNVTLKKTLKHM